MRWSVLLVSALFACNGGEPEPPPEPSVMKNCAPAPGRICPWAGGGQNGYNGDGLDKLDTWFSLPMSVAFSPYGPPAIADWNSHKIRIVQEDGSIRTIMGTDFLGDGDPDLLDMTEGGAIGTTVNLNHPTQQDYFPDGLMLSASWHTHKLRTWDPTTDRVHVLAGNLPGFTGNEAESLDECKFNQPTRARISKVDPSKVYVLDMRNERIRLVDLDAWSITTIAGNGEKSYCGDGGPALEACFNFPKNANPEPGGDLAESPDGKLLYVLDTESHIVRRIDLETGMIELFAGAPGVAGDADGAADDARFHFPVTMALSPDGATLYIADANNHKVKAIDTATRVVSTFAGTGAPSCPTEGDLVIPRYCEAQFASGDGGPALDAQLYRPMGVDVDLDGNVYVADTYNHRFRVIYR